MIDEIVKIMQDNNIDKMNVTSHETITGKVNTFIINYDKI